MDNALNPRHGLRALLVLAQEQNSGTDLTNFNHPNILTTIQLLTNDNVPDTDFGAMFKESLTRQDMRSGEIISAEVVRIDHHFVVVTAGLKSEAFIPVEEFRNDQGELEVKVGDFVSVTIDSLENGHGDTILSRDKAKRLAAWMTLEKAMESGETVMGTVMGRVKGGLSVIINGVKAFLPGSQIDVRPVKDTTPYEGKTLEFKVIKLDRKRNNVVVSHRAIIELTRSASLAKLNESIQEGAVVTGVVKNLTDYGAFVDLGGIDGLLHITDMAWRRVKHPSEMLKSGQEITAKIIRFDQEKNRVSLGMKQLVEDPWTGLSRRHQTNSRVFGKVTNVTDYGVFVEIEDGIEGLVHISEMDWTNKNVSPQRVAKPGDEVEVMVLEVDEDRRRVSLGMKQCKANPWEDFAATQRIGDRVSGPIKAITDFGIFVGLTGGIDGMVHLTDLSWTEDGIEAAKQLKKGDVLDTVVSGIDAHRERISLSVKNLTNDPTGRTQAMPEPEMTAMGAQLKKKLKR